MTQDRRAFLTLAGAGVAGFALWGCTSQPAQAAERFEVTLTDPPTDAEQAVANPRRLAEAIADEIGRQHEHASGVSFVSQVFDAHR